MIPKIIENLKNILKKSYNNDNKVRASFGYSDLAPIDDISSKSEYFNALDYALKNPKIKNIALSGPYGSGKSSIIDSYLKNNKDICKSSIKISMATIEELNNNDGGSADDMMTLEKGILKQLFYKVSHKKIPQSRYRKLHIIKPFNVYFSLLALLVVTGIAIYIFGSDLLNEINSKITTAGDNIHIPYFVSLLSVIGFVLITLIPISKIVEKILSHSQIKEIKLPADAKIDTKTDPDSIFDKNMDEIVYFFEATKYSTVFFEDFDRFQNSLIFIKLRELNILLNSNENIRNKIVFVYAIKDDIFDNEERAKFFDFIIPVIPVMNSTNAGDVLIEKFSHLNSHDISKEYILDVSPYISDMRILQNICNEFILYKRTLQSGQSLHLQDEKMLSLIILKNIYPKEFADIQRETGPVKSLFSSIKNIKMKVTQIEEECIKNDEQLLIDVQKDVLKECKEIKVAMLAALTDWKGVASIIYIRSSSGSNQYSYDTVLGDSFDLSRFNIDSDDCRIIISWITSSGSSQSNKSIDKSILLSYITRMSNCKKTEGEKAEEIKKRIEDNKKNIYNINGYSIKMLIEKYGTEIILSPDIIKNKLLTFLLRRGYIDETYPNYINYFKGQSLTKDDMNYILSVKDRHPLDYDCALANTELIIKQLQDYEFETREIYNFNMLEELLSSPKKYNSKLERFIAQLTDDEESWDFIDEFIDKTSRKETFINLITHKNQGFWELIYNNSSLTHERQVMYLKLIFAYATIEDIELLNFDKSISSFMADNENILQMLLNNSDGINIDIPLIEEIIEKLDIKFDKIDIEGLPDELTDFIFYNNCYSINKHMIELIVNKKAPQLLSDTNHRNYSTIIKLNYDPLLEYINSNINIYMDNVFFDDNNINESVGTIIILVQKYVNNIEKSIEIISHENFCAEDISSFCGDYSTDENEWVKSIWVQLLKENKVKPTWDNVISYYNRFNLDDVLQKFIGDNGDKIVSSDNTNVSDTLLLDLIRSDLETTILEKILKQNKLKDPEIDFESLEEKKMEILIKIHYVDFSISFYNIVAEIFPNLTVLLILFYKEDIQNNMEKIPLSSSVIIELLNSNDLDKEFKQKLVDVHSIKSLNKELASIILEDDYSINNKNIFFAVWSIIDEKDKNNWFLKHYNLLNCDELEDCFREMGDFYPNFADRTRRHEVSIDYSKEKEKLAEYLKDIGYITSYNKLQNDKNNKQQIIVCRIKAV